VERVAVRELAESALLVAYCTTGVEVLTPVYSAMLHTQLPWVAPPKSIVTAPEVGEAPNALNNVRRDKGVPVVLKVTVATCVQVKLLPEAVGVPGVPLANLFSTHNRTRALDEGEILAVLALVKPGPAPPEVKAVIETAALAVGVAGIP
jgi:hypothetical protein